MSTLTTRLNLTKPASAENVDITILDTNFDAIDAAVATTVGASSTRPASAFNGRMFYATDSDKLYINEAANASTVASWSDPVAQALAAISNLSISGSMTVGTGLTVTAGRGYKTYVRKTVTQSKASDTTLGNDNHITFTLAASAIYELRCNLSVSGSAAGDFKTGWIFTGPASAAGSLNRWTSGPGTTTTDVSNSNRVTRSTPWTNAVNYGLDGSLTAGIMEEGLLDTVAGSGTVTLQWAQVTSNAASTVVSTNSYAILERLA